jgi:hypothetical protein
VWMPGSCLRQRSHSVLLQSSVSNGPRAARMNWDRRCYEDRFEDPVVLKLWVCRGTDLGGVWPTRGRCWTCLWPQPHSKPTVWPWCLIGRHFLQLQLEFCRCIVQSCLTSVAVSGA